MTTIKLSDTKEFTFDLDYDVFISDGTNEGSVYRPWVGDPHNLEFESRSAPISSEVAQEVLKIHREMDRLFDKAQALLSSGLSQHQKAVSLKQ